MRSQFFRFLKFISLNFWFQRQKEKRLYILMFHQVSDEQKTFYRPTPVKVFRGICQHLWRYHKVIHISEVKAHFQKSNRSAVVISFDDGHLDIAKNAFPALSKYKLKFNINIDTEILETGLPQDFVRVYDMLNQVDATTYFDDEYMATPIKIDRENPANTENEFTATLSKLNPLQRRKFVTNMAEHFGLDKTKFSKMLSKQDVKNLSSAGAEVGSHSHSHPIFTAIPEELVEFEMLKSKNILEEITGAKVQILAYPNGQFNSNIENLALKSGFNYLLKTEDKINTIDNPETDTFFRINQYFSSTEESIASMYGFHSLVNSLRNR